MPKVKTAELKTELTRIAEALAGTIEHLLRKSRYNPTIAHDLESIVEGTLRPIAARVASLRDSL